MKYCALFSLKIKILQILPPAAVVIGIQRAYYFHLCACVLTLKPNGISHSNQLDQSILILKVFGWSFLLEVLMEFFCSV